ncbi:nodal-related 2 [Osmerus mordax]|uniref:nodal-related 2 n=1 Tax=Osmerus mordax TaxID=8014 RepID=UPI00350E8FDA
MHSLAAFSVVLHASVLLAHGIPKAKDGVYTGSLHRFGTDRSSGYHLPNYMMHLYRNFKSNLTRPMDLIEQATARQADTVKSVLAKGLVLKNRHWIVTFDLFTLLADEQIQTAELRIRFPRAVSASNVTLEIHHQHSFLCHSHNSCKEPQLVGLLTGSSVVTSSAHWKVYNVTSPLLNWLEEKRVSRRRKPPKAKRGLLFPASMKSASSKSKPSVSNRALLVVFSHTGSKEGSQAKASLLLTAEQSKFLSSAEIKKVDQPKRHRSKRDHKEDKVRSPQVPRRVNEKPLCGRVDLHVDFNQIGWGSWIVFPKKYNAYRCEGSCPSPLGEDLNPTNHAYMQSLLKHYYPDRVPSACCAPTKMSPLSMLYYENGEMLLRHHEDMIVSECGCQ